ncbi:5677_t:CDS:2, partial [Gigaspora rosea]
TVAILPFFHSDSKNSSIAHCKVCEANLVGTRQAAYAYNRNGGNTTNLINHLRDKHGITKENYLGFLDEHNEAQRLREAQNNSELLSENCDNRNPLDVLTDVKTRWNSVYYAWKRVLELHTSMKHVSTTLLTKSDRTSQWEGEKLDRLCLSFEER